MEFFCENCKQAVVFNAPNCPHCGVLFSGVKCPRCGFSGNVMKFKKACPKCGYVHSAQVEETARRKRPSATLSHKSFFIILVCLLLSSFLIGIWYHAQL